MAFSVAIKGGAAIKRQLSREQFHHAVTDLLQEASSIALTRARNKAPGHIATSLQSSVSGMEARIGSPLAEAKYVDTGRKPGGPLPPPKALEGWMNRHGFSGSSFVLARAIARRGIRGRFFMRAAAGAFKSARNRLAKHFADAWKL